jgi:hypothetical protein
MLIIYIKTVLRESKKVLFKNIIIETACIGVYMKNKVYTVSQLDIFTDETQTSNDFKRYVLFNMAADSRICFHDTRGDEGGKLKEKYSLTSIPALIVNSSKGEKRIFYTIDELKNSIEKEKTHGWNY